MAAKDERGAAGEAAAARYLEARGFTVLDRNWRGDAGEIDLVVARGRTLAIVEVKTRRSMAFGDPLNAVDPRKLARLWRLAHAWVREHRDLARGRTFRVDVIGITGEDPAAGDLEHLEDVR